MYFTKSQKNALLFIVVVFAGAIVYHLIDHYLHPVEPYDFTRFEEKFYSRRDSITKLLEEEKTLAEKSPVEMGKETKTGTKKKPAQIGGKIININTATADELTVLPRIGPAIAKRIVDYRNENGRFLRKQDIQNVRGIGPKTFEKLKDLIRVE